MKLSEGSPRARPEGFFLLWVRDITFEIGRGVVVCFWYNGGMEDSEYTEFCYKCGRMLEPGEWQGADGRQYCCGWDEE